MRTGGLLIVSCAMLAGCQTTEDRIARDDTQCQSYGVSKGSPAYVECRTNLDRNRANVAASERFGSGAGLIDRVRRASE